MKSAPVWVHRVTVYARTRDLDQSYHNANTRFFII